ncbi:MAG: hypothetical protein A3B15_01345 [Candidatus Buchananbacteria bacterium RIFCSPLOWO2_01_FULL_45_31]|uniref:Uncharacterized protein n=3 Tax=Candidatus Buchananiibacteriota TaxID=1817903 RepID=A0A1G1YLM3_9BACT|nr:MAG: hypothetical protein A3B15_01345 [Candidatus Buchananbacteria bacterium RIFCSPLOWO2_01_FULL_45_31]
MNSLLFVMNSLGYNFSPQLSELSEEGQALSRLFELTNQLELEKAKLEGVYERQQKTLVFIRQIIQAEEKILAENKDSQPLLIGGQEYGSEEIAADLNQRQQKAKQLEAQTAKSREGLDRQLNRLEAQNKLMASAKGNLELAGQKEEITLAELQALLTLEAVANSLKASSAKKSADRLAEALKAFQNLLNQAKAVSGNLEVMEAIDASLFLDGKNPVVPDRRWADYLAAEERRWQQRQAAAAEEKKREDEMDKLLIKAEEAERKQKEAEEQLRQQAEADRRRKAAEEQQRRQAEANGVPVCVVDDWSSDVPAFLFINRKTGQRIPVSTPPVNGQKQYVVKQMPIGSYHVEIQWDGRIYQKTEAEVTEELSASYDNKWYHCVVKASAGRF